MGAVALVEQVIDPTTVTIEELGPLEKVTPRHISQLLDIKMLTSLLEKWTNRLKETMEKFIEECGSEEAASYILMTSTISTFYSHQLHCSDVDRCLWLVASVAMQAVSDAFPANKLVSSSFESLVSSVAEHHPPIQDAIVFDASLCLGMREAKPVESVLMKCDNCRKFYNTLLECNDCDRVLWPSVSIRRNRRERIQIVEKGKEFRTEESRCCKDMKDAKMKAFEHQLGERLLDSTAEVEKIEVTENQEWVGREEFKHDFLSTEHELITRVLDDSPLLAVMISKYDRRCCYLYELSESTGDAVMVKHTDSTEWFFTAHVLLRAAHSIAEDSGCFGISDKELKREFVVRTNELLSLSAGLLFIRDCVIQVMTDTVETYLGKNIRSTNAALLLEQTKTTRLASELHECQIEMEEKLTSLEKRHVRENTQWKAKYEKDISKLEKKHSRDVTKLASELEKVTDSQSCIVCMDKKKEILLIPCRHLCMCVNCAPNVMETRSTCPYCGTLVTATTKVYFV